MFEDSIAVTIFKNVFGSDSASPESAAIQTPVVSDTRTTMVFIGFGFLGEKCNNGRKF